MITRHIADLLYHNECVIVPGLGGFIKASGPSRILQSTHQFFPPSGSVAFNAGLAGNDGLLASYIASVDKISYGEALHEIRQWAGTCNDTLNQGGKITLDGIGGLFRNASGNLEFTPSRQINFNADSFGLPIFFAKISETIKFDESEKQAVMPVGKKVRFYRLVPETLKWAAVLAPFIAFALWGTLNGNFVDNYVHNYTGMFSWVRSTPGKTVPVSIISSTVKNVEVHDVVLNSPSGILAEENIAFSPNVISYAELAKQNITLADTIPIESTIVALSEQKYHIIGGAFRDHNNALKLTAMLRQQGYPAAIIDTTRTGLYIVSMKGFNMLDEANLQLNEIKKAGFTASWILKKNKV